MPTGSYASGHPAGPAQREDEIFDVVDAGDNVVGRATRREVHARGLWHRAVHVLVFAPATAEGTGERGGSPHGWSGRKVFLQKRSMAKDTAPGRWDSSCSGHLDSGEDYAPAAVRELREEIGLVVNGVEALTEVLKLNATAETGWEFVRVYQLESAGPFVLHPAEIERGEWWRVEEVTRAIRERPAEFANAFRFIWEQLAPAKE